MLEGMRGGSTRGAGPRVWLVAILERDGSRHLGCGGRRGVGGNDVAVQAGDRQQPV